MTRCGRSSVAMSCDRELRYSHPDQLAEDVQAALQGQPPLHARRLRRRPFEVAEQRSPAAGTPVLEASSATSSVSWGFVLMPLAAVVGIGIGLRVGRALPPGRIMSASTRRGLPVRRPTAHWRFWPLRLGAWPTSTSRPSSSPSCNRSWRRPGATSSAAAALAPPGTPVVAPAGAVVPAP